MSDPIYLYRFKVQALAKSPNDKMQYVLQALADRGCCEVYGTEKEFAELREDLKKRDFRIRWITRYAQSAVEEVE